MKPTIEEIREDEFYLDYPWYESNKDDFYQVLDILGFYDIEAFFSGFYCQGDGASFQARYEYKKGSIKAIKEYAPNDAELHSIAKGLQLLQARARYDIGCKITQNSPHYVHSNTMRVDYIYSVDNIVENVDFYELDYLFLELFRDLADWYYKQLDDEYDYLRSDDAIQEYIDANY